MALKHSAPKAMRIGGAPAVTEFDEEANNEAMRILYASANNAGTTSYIPPVTGAKSFNASQLMGGRR